MPDTARALVWQLTAEAHHQLANSDQALAALEHSFELCYWPSTALGLLAGHRLPAYPTDGAPWLPVAQRMIRQGDGALLLSWLHGELAALPLHQQRQLWCVFLESDQGLDLEHEPALKLRWQWTLKALGVDLTQAEGQVLAAGTELHR